MWMIHENLPLLHFHIPNADLVFRGILVLALLVFVLAVYQFWRHQTTVNPMKINEVSSLISGGIFRLSLNPIYVADVLILVAWFIWLGVWINVAWIVLFIWYVQRFQILPEEKALTLRFGDEWHSYSKRVRRWL